MEYKKEEKMEYKKETYPMKMEYGSKKYRRSIDDDMEEDMDEAVEDSEKIMDLPVPLLKKEIETIKNAVIRILRSKPNLFSTWRYSRYSSIIDAIIRGIEGVFNSVFSRDPTAMMQLDDRRAVAKIAQAVSGMKTANWKKFDPSITMPSSDPGVVGSIAKGVKRVFQSIFSRDPVALMRMSDPGVAGAIARGVTGVFRSIFSRDPIALQKLGDPGVAGALARGIGGVFKSIFSRDFSEFNDPQILPNGRRQVVKWNSPAATIAAVQLSDSIIRSTSQGVRGAMKGIFRRDPVALEQLNDPGVFGSIASGVKNVFRSIFSRDPAVAMMQLNDPATIRSISRGLKGVVADIFGRDPIAMEQLNDPQTVGEIAKRVKQVFDSLLNEDLTDATIRLNDAIRFQSLLEDFNPDSSGSDLMNDSTIFDMLAKEEL